MLEAVHKHLLYELERSGRTDTIFVLAGSSFNVMNLFISWARAEEAARQLARQGGYEDLILLVLFMLATLIVTAACVKTLYSGLKICISLHDSLDKLYASSNVSEFIPNDLRMHGDKRVLLSIQVVVCTGALALFVPAIVFFVK